MISFDEVKIDYSGLAEIERIAKEKENTHPACKLIKYWSDRMPDKMKKNLFETGKLPYGYVGDGWPLEKDQTKVIKFDKRNFKNYYRSYHNRDTGDAIYQANLLMDHLNIKSKYDRVSIMDFGAGYGRLAIPFLNFLHNVRYYAVDSVPLSLLIAPQMIKSLFSDLERQFYVYDYEHRITPLNQPDKVFYSIPSWELEDLNFQQYDLFVSIHSFQEMTRSAVDYYVDFAHRQTKMLEGKKSYFYSINIDPKDKYVPDSWDLIFDRGFPINRDGNYNEKLWLIK